MIESSDAHRQTAPIGPDRRTALAKVRRLFAGLNLMILTGLSTLYLAVGDQTAWGEYFTIWPSFFWVVPLAPLLFFGTQFAYPRHTIAQWAVMAAFLLLTVEWRALIRFDTDAKRKAFEIRRVELKDSVLGLRLISWNMDSASAGKAKILAELAPLSPDVCFFQETPDGNTSLQSDDLTGPWSGYYWFDAGDCGILSRFPMTALASERVGPWEKPLVVKVDLPNGESLACVNVRLALPSLVLNPFSSSNRQRLTGDHAARIGQFPKLVTQIVKLEKEQNLDMCILAGDFNTPATAHSENVLKTLMRDSWKEAGCGWGATMTNSFPVSRIDQCWVSKRIEVRSAWVVNPNLSDHRYLVVDTYLQPPGSKRNL